MAAVPLVAMTILQAHEKIDSVLWGMYSYVCAHSCFLSQQDRIRSSKSMNCSSIYILIPKAICLLAMSVNFRPNLMAQ